MFDVWRRPRKDMPPKKGGVTSVAFDDVAEILRNETLAVTASAISRDGRFSFFLHGLNLARELAVLRAAKQYGMIHVVLTILFVKTLNDLLCACLSIRAGYSLQAFPSLRSALESAELMEYLCAHPEMADDYVRAAGQFERDTSWIRNQLPATDTRTKIYDFLNYFTHANFKGLNIFTSYEWDDNTTAVKVGPTEPVSPILKPYDLAGTFVAYAIRVIWRSDESAASWDWVTRFQEYDESAQNFLAEVPSVEDITDAG